MSQRSRMGPDGAGFRLASWGGVIYQSPTENFPHLSNQNHGTMSHPRTTNELTTLTSDIKGAAEAHLEDSGGLLRLSPHFYISGAELEALDRILTKCNL